MPRRLLTAVSLALGLGANPACGGLLQSYPAGIQVLCDAPDTCEPCASASDEMRMAMLASHVEENLHNGQAIALFEALAYVDTATRAEMLRHEAKGAGIGKCRLAEVFESEHRMALARGAEDLCATTCGRYDDFDAVVKCIEEAAVPQELIRAITGTGARNLAAIGKELETVGRNHGLAACAFASRIRNP